MASVPEPIASCSYTSAPEPVASSSRSYSIANNGLNHNSDDTSDISDDDGTCFAVEPCMNVSMHVSAGKDPLELDSPTIIKPEIVNNNFDGDTVDKLISFQFEVYDDDVLMYYDDDAAFKPMISQWEMKRNDVFSGTLAYAEYTTNNESPDSKDRGYMIDIDGQMKEVRIKAEYLNKFIKWNTIANDSMVDSRFVSTLMIICIGMKKLRTGDYHPNTVAFIRGMYLLLL